jgi:hypothetical protein
MRCSGRREVIAMVGATVSARHARRTHARGELWTGRKWKRHETALFAAVVSGVTWALIVAVAAIIL